MPPDVYLTQYKFDDGDACLLPSRNHVLFFVDLRLFLSWIRLFCRSLFVAVGGYISFFQVCVLRLLRIVDGHFVFDLCRIVAPVLV